MDCGGRAVAATPLSPAPYVPDLSSPLTRTLTRTIRHFVGKLSFVIVFPHHPSMWRQAVATLAPYAGPRRKRQQMA